VPSVHYTEMSFINTAPLPSERDLAREIGVVRRRVTNEKVKVYKREVERQIDARTQKITGNLRRSVVVDFVRSFDAGSVRYTEGRVSVIAPYAKAVDEGRRALPPLPGNRPRPLRMKGGKVIFRRGPIKASRPRHFMLYAGVATVNEMKAIDEKGADDIERIMARAKGR
jgi:hypothetical protein